MSKTPSPAPSAAGSEDQPLTGRDLMELWTRLVRQASANASKLSAELSALGSSIRSEFAATTKALREDMSSLKEDVSALRGELGSTTASLDEKIENAMSRIDDHERRLDEVTWRAREASQRIESIQLSTQEDIIAEMNSRRSKERNLIFYSVPESRDLPNGRSFLDTLVGFGFALGELRLDRLGKSRSDPNLPRPLKVMFPSSGDAHRVFGARMELFPQPISCSFDKTPMQRTYIKEVMRQLKLRRDAGETNVKVKYINGTPTIVSSASSIAPKN